MSRFPALSRATLPYAVLAASLLLTAAAASLMAMAQRARDRARFANAVESTRDRITGRLDTYTTLLRGAAGLFAASDTVTRADFREYVGRLHVGYEDLRDHPETVIANAKALGAKWVGLAWYPHEGAFTEADARHAVADFNRFGRTMKDAGLSFFYHDHGFEPVPNGDGTLLDLMIRETDPQLVHFEMDVLWTWLPGVDPVALIRKYPGRFRLMHIKDMKPGVPRGSLTGGLPDSLEAAIGEGQVPWPALMQAAQQDGFEEYYIEDETPAPLTNVPKSIRYLETLRY